MALAAQPPSISKAPRLVALEREWRCPPFPGAPLAGGIFASRWVDERGFPRSVAVVHGADHHTTCLILRPSSLELEVEGSRTHSGSVMPGMVQISAPGTSVHAILRDPCDFLHFRVPNLVLAARCQKLEVHPWEDEEYRGHSGFKNEAVIIKLTQALLATQAATGDLYSGYVEGFASSIVTRLVTKPGDGRAPAKARRVDGLPKWRLKRALNFIDAHLADPIHLGDMAAAAGLSRMHFAAQFRKATGFRPREYLLRRRIDQAKGLLASTDVTLVNVALSVGFSNQAHFSTVFGRFVGQTPAHWRRANSSAGVVVPNRKTTVVQEGTIRRDSQDLGEAEGANV